MKKQPKTTPSHNKSEDQHAHSDRNPIIVSCTFPPISDEERAEKNQERTRNRRKFRLEVAGFIILLFYTFFTGMMYFANKKAADAAKQSADTAARQLELSERPWITADLISVGPITYDDPKRFKIQFAIKIANVGHSPAVNVNIAPKVVDPWGMKFNGDIMDQQKAICEGYAKIKAGEAWGRTMFPGRDYTDTFAHDLSRDEITAITTPNMEKFWPKDRVKPYILGCVDYTVAFSGVHHQTYFVYDLWGTSESGKIAYLIMGVNTPAARIKFYTNSPFIVPSN